MGLSPLHKLPVWSQKSEEVWGFIELTCLARIFSLNSRPIIPPPGFLKHISNFVRPKQALSIVPQSVLQQSSLVLSGNSILPLLKAKTLLSSSTLPSLIPYAHFISKSFWIYIPNAPTTWLFQHLHGYYPRPCPGHSLNYGTDFLTGLPAPALPVVNSPKQPEQTNQESDPVTLLLKTSSGCHFLSVAKFFTSTPNPSITQLLTIPWPYFLPLFPGLPCGHLYVLCSPSDSPGRLTSGPSHLMFALQAMSAGLPPHFLCSLIKSHFLIREAFPGHPS